MSSPEWNVAEWFNTDHPLTLADFAGRIVVLEAFQMLCPGCVAHGLPLAQAVSRTFPTDKVAVIGLHTVFEHHAAMTPVALKAFLHEYRINFPVGVDMPDGVGLPRTMRLYGMRGTPSLLLFDQSGTVRAHHFGDVSELRLGAEIGTLIAEGQGLVAPPDTVPQPGTCDAQGCAVPGA